MGSSRILVVEEQSGVLQAITWVLKEHGYQVSTAFDAVALFEQLEARPPDLLLLDLVMPDVDGFQVLERIKADDRWRDLPVLAMSSLPAEEATVKTLGLGAADFIRKPFKVRELLARIQAQLRARAELRATRDALRAAHEELSHAREEAENRRKLVDILHEVTGDLASEEIYHILARRVARALNISRCSVILARPGDRVGVVATAFENPGLRNLEIQLERYPEIRAALEHDRPVLIEDLRSSPLYADVRREWELEGTDVVVRSVIALPFSIEREQAGVFFLRSTDGEPPLTQEDVEFADAVIKAAVAAIQRAQLIETTRADNARLEQLAHTDPLTQVLNRRALILRLSAELERARRYDSVVTLLMIDLDHFKRVNDTYGHLVGDDVLRAVALLLRSAVRSVDVVARYGGEEFVVVLPETGEEGATIFAERIRESIEGHNFGLVGATLRLTASIGVALFPAPETETADDLFAAADAALYRAKAEGRNRVLRALDLGSPPPPRASGAPTPDERHSANPGPAASAPTDTTSASEAEDEEIALEGEVLDGRYAVVRKIDEGGMSRVYLAMDVHTNERFAIKLLSSSLSHDRKALAPLRKEALLGRRLEHPNVCHIIRMSEMADGHVYLVMPFVDGEPLSDLRHELREIPLGRVVRLVQDIAAGLHHAHQLKIVHCDLKPENVMVVPTPDGGERAVVMDFGVATERRSWSDIGRAAKAGHVHGTPEFMSPEQVRGRPMDTRSDIYALALLTYEMLTGRLPFEGRTPQDTMLARLTSDPIAVRQMRPDLDLPAEVEQVLAKGMAREIDERYPSALKFADALAAAAGEPAVAAGRGGGVFGRIFGK